MTHLFAGGVVDELACNVLSVICKEEEFQVDYFVLFLRG
jgi:hypothetical protein